MNDVSPGGPGWADPRADAILGIVAKETGVARELLSPDASIDALGVASLDMVQTIFALESHYDIEIPVVSDQAGAEFATVGSLVSHVLATLDRATPVGAAPTGPA